RSSPTTAHTPVIFLSEERNPSVIEESLRRGARDCLFKPLDRTQLLNAASANAQTHKPDLETTQPNRLVPAKPASPSPAHTSVPGHEIEGYRVLKLLGTGGMSQVFLAERTGTGRKEVLKLIPFAADSDYGNAAVQQFLREFALLSQLSHPNIARIYDQGYTATHAFIAMEYIEGGDLRKLMAQRLAPEIAVAALLQITGALSAVHAKGFIHRDLKPDNVMVRADGTLVLVDFGIALDSNITMTWTPEGQLHGTPYYIAPEQVAGAKIDQRCDIYSLGVMFFEMLAGYRPYQSPNLTQLLGLHTHGPIPNLPADVAHFQPLINGLMAKDPSKRFPSAAVVTAAVMRSHRPQVF
ncbi:MAG: protein kinase domain-containing protein, partial [Burkholderiales bacterium]